MKSTKAFKEVIKQHLDQRAASDELFAVTYAKENKNLDDCITYILNRVKSSGSNGFADSEIFGMAVHYYDEDDIKVGSRIDAKVVVNHAIELSEEEIADAKQKAIDEVIQEQRNKMLKKAPAKSKNVFNKKSEDTKQKEIKLEVGDNYMLF